MRDLIIATKGNKQNHGEREREREREREIYTTYLYIANIESISLILMLLN